MLASRSYELCIGRSEEYSRTPAMPIKKHTIDEQGLLDTEYSRNVLHEVQSIAFGDRQNHCSNTSRLLLEAATPSNLITNPDSRFNVLTQCAHIAFEDCVVHAHIHTRHRLWNVFSNIVLVMIKTFLAAAFRILMETRQPGSLGQVHSQLETSRYDPLFSLHSSQSPSTNVRIKQR